MVAEKEMNKLLTHNDGIQLCCTKVNEEGNSALFSVENSDD